MPECENCESHVTEDYARVFGIDGVVEVCPFCEDKVRGARGRPRDARAKRRTTRTDDLDDHVAPTRADGGGQ